MLRFAWSAALVPIALGLVAGAASCAHEPGYLVVAVQTNLETPKDLDAFAVLVESGGAVKYDYVAYPPPSGSVTLPATLVVSQPKEPSAEVHVRVVGFRDGAARIVRDAFTKVPSQRSALLRLTLDYLDDGSASGALPAALTAPGFAGGAIAVGDFDPRAIASRCDVGQRTTSLGGACASAVVDSASLPDYDPSSVVAAGPCFDPGKCFASATPITAIDLASCTATLPDLGTPVLGLATRDGSGGCVDGHRCFVPLAPSAVVTNGGAAPTTLAPGVCAKIAAGDALVAGGGCGAWGEATSVCTEEIGDAGIDSTLANDGGDATVDGGSDDGEAGSILDAGPDCDGVLGAALSAAIVPPAKWAGIDLSRGGAFSGAFGTGGANVPAELLACASSIEPDTLTDGGVAFYPGYRHVVFGTPMPGAVYAPLELEVNLDSRVPYYVTVSKGYRGHVQFHSRTGGAFGQHSYELRVSDSNVDGGAPTVLRDGLPFVPDLHKTTTHTTAWVNEMYDGLMATFQPSAPAVTDCVATKSSLYSPGSVIPQDVTNCLVLANSDAMDGVLGIRPLHFYITFAADSTIDSMYAIWLGGATSCGTLRANTERMDYEFMSGGQEMLDGGVYQVDKGLGGINSRPGILNAKGMTVGEANAIECSGVSASAPDPGYKMMQWGPLGEVAMEYNSFGVNYKLFARTGYRGQLDGYTNTFDDGGTDTYTVQLDTLLHGSAPVVIDWTSVATASATITGISNAAIGTWCGTWLDDDCVAAGNCTITPDDGAGHSTFVLSWGSAVTDACGVTTQPVGFVFDKGTSRVTGVYIVNPEGK